MELEVESYTHTYTHIALIYLCTTKSETKACGHVNNLKSFFGSYYCTVFVMTVVGVVYSILQDVHLTVTNTNKDIPKVNGEWVWLIPSS